MNDELRQSLADFYDALHKGRGRKLSGRGCNKCGVQPKESDALAVHPLDVPEAIESARRHGVPTDFTANGSPIIRSRAHQKAYLKAYGFKNKDAGYGD